MMENCGSYSHQNTSAVSTVGAMKGSSMMARMADLKMMLRFSSSASHKPSANFSRHATLVYSSVLNTDSHRTSSFHSDRKFSRPMKTPARPILVSVSPSQTPRPSG